MVPILTYFLRGIVMENQFIFELKDENKDFDYDYLAMIEEKIYKSCLSEKEVLYLLKWVVYRVQSFLLPDYPTLEYRCCDAAEMGSALLNSLNINHFKFNMKSIINSTFAIHELILAYLPIDDCLVKYVIDPTFRQFLVKEYCKPNRLQHYKFDNPTFEYDRKLPTYPGYYLSLTEEGRKLGTSILNDGFFELNEENMKLYSDAFMKYSSMYISDFCLCGGEEYIDGIKPSQWGIDLSFNKDVCLTPKKIMERV